MRDMNRGVLVVGHGSRRYEANEDVREATRRIGGVTEELLQFTRKRALAPQRVELAAMISGLEDQIETCTTVVPNRKKRSGGSSQAR